MERKRRIFHLSLAALAAAALLLAFYLLGSRGIGIPCPFYRITGLQCPGCGNSRAALALMRLDFSAAFAFNALFPLEFSYILWVIFQYCRSYLRNGSLRYNTPSIWVDIIVLAAVLLWWPLRNILGC